MKEINKERFWNELEDADTFTKVLIVGAKYINRNTPMKYKRAFDVKYRLFFNGKKGGETYERSNVFA